MSRLLKPDVVLGLLVTAFSLVLLFLWIPNDVDGDAINIVRRRASIGDPMAPTVTGYLLLISGTMLAVTGFFRPVGKEAFTRRNLAYVAATAAVLALFVSVMLFTGPVLVSALGIAEEYRLVRTTPPWKYSGYLIGGSALMIGMIVAVERRLSRRTLILGLMVPLAIALFYDLPFDDTLLPPNGDY